MRIAVLTTSYPRSESNDAGVFVARLLDSLEPLGVTGEVYVPKDANESYQRLSIFPVVRFGYSLVFPRKLAFGAGIMPNIRRNPFAIFQAPGLLFGFVRSVWAAQRNFSVIHANWVIAAIPGAILSLLLQSSLVVTARGEDIRLLHNRIFRLFITGFLLRAKVIVAVGDAAKSEMSRLLPSLATRMTVVENGVKPVEPTESELERLRGRYNLGTSRRYIVCVGSVIARKGVIESIRVVAALEGAAELLICGRLDDEHYVSECRSECSTLGITDRVHFLGAVPPDEVWGILKLSAVYLSSSRSEGRPNAMIEALAIGLPVIASDIAPHSSLLVPHGAGLLFRDVNDAADKLKSVLHNPDMHQQLSARAEESQRNCGWDITAKKYLEVYRAISGRES